MKPKYDEFVNTKMDLINRDMTLGEIITFNMYHVGLPLVLYPGQQWLIDFMKESSDSVYNLLAGKTISLQNDWYWKKTDVMIENHVLTDGTHAFMTSNMRSALAEMAEKLNTHWFRSSDTVLSENPFTSWTFRDGSKLETMSNFSQQFSSISRVLSVFYIFLF